MKLSQISTDEAMNKIVEITPYVDDILKDGEVIKIVKEKLNTEGIKKEELMEKGFEKGLEKVTKLVAILLKNKRESIFHILSIMNDKTVEEVKKQSLITTMKEITEIFTDKELRELFL